MNGIEDAIQSKLDSLKETLNQTVQPIYKNNDLTSARKEVDRSLSHTLSEFQTMFGFPDSKGMSTMAEAVTLVIQFMLNAGDNSGAKELRGRGWAFGGGIPSWKELKDAAEAK